MAVGKGSMDRASRAMKHTEAKESEIHTEELIEKTAGEKKVRSKSGSTKKASASKKKRGVKDEAEVKASVIAATDPQVLAPAKKTQEENNKEQSLEAASSISYGIGDEMPVYYL